MTMAVVVVTAKATAATVAEIMSVAALGLMYSKLALGNVVFQKTKTAQRMGSDFCIYIRIHSLLAKSFENSDKKNIFEKIEKSVSFFH